MCLKKCFTLLLLFECTFQLAEMNKIHAAMKNKTANFTNALPRRNFKLGRKAVPLENDKDDPYKITKLIPLAKETTTVRTTLRLTDVPALEPLLTPYSIKHLMKKFAKKKENYANTTIEVIGKTIEYNEIVLLKMTEAQENRKKFFRTDDNKYSKEVGEKRIIFIIHGLNTQGIESVPGLHELHDFEILAGIYIKHLDKFDIFFIPVANPDGLAKPFLGFTNGGKNSSPQEACPGVFLDRNFNVAWNESLKVNSCHMQYPGPESFSERESRAILNILHQYNQKIAAFINVHSNPYVENIKGEAVLFPRGYTEVSNDDDKYYDMKGEVEEALKNVTIKSLPFEMTSLHHWYGKISGSSVDYAAEVYGIPYALEFVMQPFNTQFNKLVYTKYVLKDIWETVIDAIFNHIHKNMNEIK